MQFYIAYTDILAHVYILDGAGQIAFLFHAQTVGARLAPFEPEVPEFISVPGWH
jgi:hypothetical protein